MPFNCVCCYFQECDVEGSGLVEVGNMVDFIRKMQLGQRDSGEEVYDSDEDVSPFAWSGRLQPYRLYMRAQ